MTSLDKTTYNPKLRARLLGIVKLASERTAVSWPMHTFISRNPLHDFEHLDFHDAVLQAKQHMGGEGYLSNKTYRRYFETGRIREADLDKALKGIASDQAITLEGRKLSHLEVLRAHFTQGLSAPAPEILESMTNNHANYETLSALSEKLSAFVKPIDIRRQIDHFAEDYHAGLGRCLTLSGWLDHIFGTDLSEQINQEMIKWCLPFLDEGQAPWPLPFREKGLYAAWRILAAKEGIFGKIRDMREKIERTPQHPLDMLLENLLTLGIPETAWEEYLGFHLSAIPGWTALVKWRSAHQEYQWQESCPIDLVQYLGIRLWYEREWTELMSQELMETHGTLDAISDYIAAHPGELFLRREHTAKRLTPLYTEAIEGLSQAPLKTNAQAWETLANQYAETARPQQKRLASLSAAWRLVSLSETLNISSQVLRQSAPEDLQQVIAWIDAIPEAQHGPIWLEAFEAGFQENLLNKLAVNVGANPEAAQESATEARPRAQAVFCIDVRSESLRRHFEKIGHYETYGFAGFFTAFIRYLGFGSHHETDLFPAVAKAKNVVKEIPRPSEKEKIPRHRAGRTFMHAVHTLLHDLKENIITPYVMVESMGWFFGIPLIGKTLFPMSYQRWSRRLKKRLAPPIATTLTLEKKTRESVDDMIASEQNLIIKEALRVRPGRHKKTASSESIQALRKLAMERGTARELLNEAEQKALAPLFESPEAIEDFVKTLRNEYYITEAWASARMERITRTGFSDSEQALTVGTALKVMGLTKNFAKLVLFCGHGSTSDNNPYEAALDCGACGGNPGNPNARVLAALANKAHVRAALKKENIVIPEDTYFIAGQHDTTTDEVVFYDLEDLPPTHQAPLAQLTLDLKTAGMQNSQERCGRFPDVPQALSAHDAIPEVIRRSATWSQTRPEWGLSGNAAIVISRGTLIKNANLEGRVFLHSYLQEEDPTGQLLEIILTGPQVVAQWINMEYYFSTTDNEVYGSGSKIYHNIAGRVGVMYGASSDLRMGLPWQTVGNGPMPYHEAMRLFTVIEAPRARISQIIKQHTVLQEHFNNRWVHLVALESGQFYRYQPDGTWQIETFTHEERSQ